MSAARIPEREAARLLEELEPQALSLARAFYVPGHDRDDVLQLARLGFVEALRVWDGRRPLGPLAWLAGRRRILDAIRAAQAEHRAGDHAARAWQPEGLEDPEPLIELMPDPISLEQYAEARARLRTVAGALGELTANELAHLPAVLGLERYGRTVTGSKAAENAVDRARGKLRAAIAAA